MARLKPVLTFVQDSREQNPVRFAAPFRREFANGGTVVEGLGEGDYAVILDLGPGSASLLPIRIERKSLGDLYGCIGHGRERFVRELERLVAYDYRAIVIEATADQVIQGYPRSQVYPRAVMASLCCWSVRYGLGIWFAESHRRAGGIIQRCLEEYALHWLKETSPGGENGRSGKPQ